MTTKYETELWILQQHAAGLLSTRTAIEKLGFVDNPDEELAQIKRERFDFLRIDKDASV